MPTFITSKAVEETINIYAETSTGYWKYNHDGSDSSVFVNGWEYYIPVSNENGEFTIIPCLSDGTVSGDATIFSLGDNQITSFDGTGLSSLTELALSSNLLTSFDGNGLSSLTYLGLGNNLLTSINVAGLSSLTNLSLNSNLLTSFDGTGLSSLTNLDLQNNQLTSFNPTGLTSLTELQLSDNQLPSLAYDQILHKLSQNGLTGGYFQTTNGSRTPASNIDYNNLLNNLVWELYGLDLIPIFQTRQFAYDPDGGEFPDGTIKVGNLCIGNSPLDYSSNPGGLTWWMGPDETTKFIIAKDFSAGNRKTPLGNVGTVFFKKCDKNESAFINLVNHISGTTQANANAALSWLSANGYWTSYQPGVITTGLQLYLDAGDTSSYSGSGTTWYDISGNANNVEMQNSGGISWTDGGIGYFSTGSSGYFTKNSAVNMPTGSSLYTFSAWIQLGSSWGGQGIMSVGPFGISNQANALRTASTNLILNYWWANDFLVNTSVSPANSWFNVVARDNGTNRSIWINGVSAGTGSRDNHNVTNSNVQIAKTSGAEYLNGNIAQALIYNVALTDTQILENFNATKSRFGL